MNFINPFVGAGDPYWANVVALLHCDGPDDSVIFTDQRHHTFAPSGNAKLDTAQSKFGSASGLFDGNLDYLYAARSDDWNVGSGDFTLELFVRPTLSPMPDWALLIGKMQARDAAGTSMGLWLDPTLHPNFAISDGSNAYQISQTAVDPLTINAWNWLALSRNTNTWRLLLNGTVVITHNQAITVGHDTTTTFGGLALGGYGAYQVAVPPLGELGKYAYTGYMDDIRLTKGVGRYTGDTAVPTAAFPNF